MAHQVLLIPDPLVGYTRACNRTIESLLTHKHEYKRVGAQKIALNNQPNNSENVSGLQGRG
jgi:hypothetical protein